MVAGVQWSVASLSHDKRNSVDLHGIAVDSIVSWSVHSLHARLPVM